MTRILLQLRQFAPEIHLQPDLKAELDLLPLHNQRFTKLLNEITTLTHQLEQRYRGILPFSVESTPFQRLTTRLHLRRDPARVLWQHNDRYERKMIELRDRICQRIILYCLAVPNILVFSLYRVLIQLLYELLKAQGFETDSPLKHGPLSSFYLPYMN